LSYGRICVLDAACSNTAYRHRI